MERSVLLSSMMALGLVAQAQLSIGTITPLESPGNRGTDTLFTYGVEQAFAAQQIAAYTTPGGGMLFGPSEFPVTDVAQQFELFGAGATVDGIVFWFPQQAYTSGNANSHVKARLWQMNGTNGSITGTPGTAQCPNTVAREVNVPVSGIPTQDFTYANFAPIWMPSTFAVGYNLSGLSAGDSVNVAATVDGFVELEDYSWIRLLSAWSSVRFATQGAANIDLVIGPIFTPSSIGVEENTWVNGMRMTIVEGTVVNDLFNLRYSVRDAMDMRLTVMDATGRTVVDERLGIQSGEQQRTISTNGWNQGQYFVSLFANGRPVTKRLIVH
jgi:hypothetical protein